MSDIANLHYVDGPPMDGSSSRPWWILDSSLEHDMRATDRWNDVVSFPFGRSWCVDAYRTDRYAGEMVVGRIIEKSI